MDYKTRESLTKYILDHYGEFISLEDIAKLGSAAMDDYTKAVFRCALAERIVAEHKDKIFLNYCPVCGRLARTPMALQCPNGHRWSGSGTPGISG